MHYSLRNQVRNSRRKQGQRQPDCRRAGHVQGSRTSFAGLSRRHRCAFCSTAKGRCRVCGRDTCQSKGGVIGHSEGIRHEHKGPNVNQAKVTAVIRSGRAYLVRPVFFLSPPPPQKIEMNSFPPLGSLVGMPNGSHCVVENVLTNRCFFWGTSVRKIPPFRSTFLTKPEPTDSKAFVD